MTVRHTALALLLAATLTGCVCAPAASSLLGPPSEAEIAEARRAFGQASTLPRSPAGSKP